MTRTLTHKELVELFSKYPNTIIPSVGSIIFLHIENVGYDSKKELEKELMAFNGYPPQIDKLRVLLSGEFTTKAPEDVFLKTCQRLMELELAHETSRIRTHYLAEAVYS